ncbi:MAG: hypothetical protein Q8L93_06125 [Rhodocyclaceae bacterium]|nr:hypothetical protein [Rhodocyclaceae bacterium]
MNGHATLSIGKWGNSLAMRLGRDIERATGLAGGDRIDVQYSVEGETVTLRMQKAKPHRRYTLEELLAGCNAGQRPDDAWAGLAPSGREKL